MIYSSDKQNGLDWKQLDDNFLLIENNINVLSSSINTLQTLISAVQSSSFTIEYLNISGSSALLSSSINPKIIIASCTTGSIINLPSLINNNCIYIIKNDDNSNIYSLLPINTTVGGEYIEQIPSGSIFLSNEESVTLISNKINKYNVY